MKARKSKFSGVPFSEFRHAPNMLKSELWRYVQKKHREAGIDCGADHAINIAKTIIKQSNENRRQWQECKKEGNASDRLLKSIEQQIWLVCEGDYVRGYYTQAKGAVAARHKNSYRSKLSNLPAAPREEFLQAIMRIVGCDQDKAESILETGRRNEFFKCCDRKLGIWRGVDAYEPKDLSTISKSKRLTEKQRAHWEIFGKTPNLAYELEHGRVKLSSEVILWIIGRIKEVRDEDIDAEEAVIRLDRARRCSQIRELTPFEATAGRIRGRNYYLPGSFRLMPRFYLTNSDIKRSFDGWLMRNSLPGSDHQRLLEQAVEAGDVKQAEIKDPFGESPAYIGVETLDADRKAQAAKKAIKTAQEVAKAAADAKREEDNIKWEQAKIQAEKAFWEEQLKDRNSQVSRQLVVMPCTSTLPKENKDDVSDHVAAIWIADNMRIYTNGERREITGWAVAYSVLYTAKDLGYIIYEELGFRGSALQAEKAA
jgi:hypothetical protein